MRNPFAARLDRSAMVKRRGSAFAGAANSRLTADFIHAQLRSINKELRSDSKALRARARDLGRNDPYGNRFLSLFAENVIGATGVGFQSRVTDANGKPDREVNRTIERAFARWGKPHLASADRKLSWIGHQQLAARTMAQDGEALIRLLPGFDNEFGFALQQFDPDQLDTDYNRPAGRGENEIVLGIEINGWGAAVAYHCWSHHPDDWRRERVRIPADQLIHLFLVQRPGQMRGIPEAAPVIVTARMLNGFQEAYLVACRVGASKMGFFQRAAEEEPDPDLPEGDETFTSEASPGQFDIIPDGWELKEWSPDYPASGYADYVKSMLRTQATGYGVGYNMLSNDLEGVNYTSIRAGLITERDMWRVRQVHVIEHFHDVMYPVWLKWAITSGAVRVPSFDYRDYLEYVWQPRGWIWVDPLKEALAAEKLIELGMDSRTRMVGEQGRDLEQTFIDLQREKELAQEYGVPISPAPTASDQALARALWDEDEPPPARRNGNHRLATARS